MNGFDLHVLAILALINFTHHIAQMRLLAVFPRGVFTRDAERAAEASVSKRILRMSSCLRLATELRTEPEPARPVSPTLKMPRLQEVCTSPGMSMLIDSMPLG